MESPQQRFHSDKVPFGETPLETLSRLKDAAHRWLRPEEHTKEQIVDMIILEQFLIVLPIDLQVWLRAKEPSNCKEAASLAETFLGKQEPADVTKLPVTFENLSFTKKEWVSLEPEQKTLYFEVVEENYETALSAGNHQKEWLTTQKAIHSQGQIEQQLFSIPSYNEKKDPTVVIKMEQACEQEDLRKEESEIAPLQIKQEKDDQTWYQPPVQQGDHMLEEKENLENSLEENLKSQVNIKFEQEESDHACSLPIESHKYISQFAGDQKMLISEKSSYKGPECERSLNLDSVFMGQPELLPELKPPSYPISGKDLSSRSSCPKTSDSSTAERCHTCEKCGKSFVWKSSLVRHQMIHTGEKPHRCHECDKSFHVRSSLIAHLRIHTGERPFQCGDCGKCFRTKSYLTAHQIVHRDKQFPCPDCGKRFRRRAHLQSHYRTHTGERPHQCFICGKCFTGRASLVRHERIHSMNDATQRVSLQVCSA
ncbi:zinc finger protein 397-like [Tiliqua scincoides]|uniref:zinc finger protein 397-like n=1 Tax=Tiliqua scincoides TaxID=71010 RepID=UPI0034633C95